MRAVSPLQAFAERLEARSPLGRPAREAVPGLPSRILQIQPGRAFATVDQAAPQTWLVVDGLVARYAETGRGERQVTELHIAGDLAHLDGLVGGRTDPGLQALAVTTLLALPLAELRQASSRHDPLHQALARERCIQTATLAAWLVNVGRRKSLPRTAHLFCELAVRHGRETGAPQLRFPFPARQNQLAEILALTPVHINRTLKALREEGLVSFADRDACIHDWDRLVRLADFDPSYLQ